MSVTFDRTSHSPSLKRARSEENDSQDTVQEQPNLNVEERPGDAWHPETFINCYSSDKKLTAYVGYQNTSELHILAVSWPLLRATVAMQPIAHKLPKELALALLRDAQHVGGHVVPDDKWALLDSDGKGTTNERKAEHLAVILVNMRNDISRMASQPDHQNVLQHQNYSQLFRNTYGPTYLCPRATYPIKVPLLHPLEAEGFLEPYNRCLVLLRHVRAMMKKDLFNNRYKNDGYKFGNPIADDTKPAWMRTQTTLKADGSTTQNGHETAKRSRSSMASSATFATPQRAPPRLNLSELHSEEFKPCQPVENTEQSLFASPVGQIPVQLLPGPTGNTDLPPKSFTVVWDHAIEPEHNKSRLKRALDRAKARGVHLPSELQKLKCDPRQMAEPSLYQQIRVQYECEPLGIDPDKMFLMYTTSAFGDSMTVTQNLDSELWSDTQAALSDPANSKFVLRVGFFARD